MGKSREKYAERDQDKTRECFNYYRQEFNEEAEFLTLSVEPGEENVVLIDVGAAPG